MFLDSRILFFFGATLIGGLMATLYSRAPMPAKITDTHAAVIAAGTIESCQTCHHEEGLDRGCLECHTEIDEQLRSEKGYHHFLAQADEFRCADCHAEHLGSEFPLVNDVSWGGQVPESFVHPHVAFDLEGVHQKLACEECHDAKREGPFHMADFPQIPRDHTFLGLNQDCRFCHDDPHAEGFSSACGECHGQEAFLPPMHFDHDDHFRLVGNHDGLECSSCHEFNFPDAESHASDPIPHPFPFNQVRGTTCGECHSSPHRADFSEACHECHALEDPVWAVAADQMTPGRHAQTGFHLRFPHNQVACESCHTPGLAFAERHPDPASPSYEREQITCQGCHEDVHQNQFSGRYERCIDCHNLHTFQPPTFGLGRHELRYPLTGAHGAVTCVQCHEKDTHGTRQFVGTTQACRECHDSPHGTQFSSQISKGDCKACHNDIADTFSLQPFDHVQWTGFELQGAHTKANCEDCHRLVDYEVHGQTVSAHRYEQTPTECAGCHTDVHRGQFEHYASCSVCHTSQDDWHDYQFDHNTQSRFPLEGAHVDVACASCHRPVPFEGREGDSTFIQYRPLGRDCRDCHEIDPRIQTKKR